MESPVVSERPHAVLSPATGRTPRPGGGPCLPHCGWPLGVWSLLPSLLAGAAIATALWLSGADAAGEGTLLRSLLTVAATALLAAGGSFLVGCGLERRIREVAAGLLALPGLAPRPPLPRDNALGQLSTVAGLLRSSLATRQQSEAELAVQARHDLLTGLANRALFREKLAATVTGLPVGKGFAILAIDLDRFKAVNDTFGHAMGDQLLCSVGRRLRTCCRESDVVARLGGDEFALLLADTDRPEDVANLARRLVGTVSSPYGLGDKEVVIGASVGIALAPLDGTDPALLMEHADQALYRAKNEGRHGFQFFEPGIGTWAQALLALREDLMPAVIGQEFRLFYQPVFELTSDRIVACETQLRWQHRTRGMVRAADFMSIAERSDAIEPLTEWMLRQACAQAAGWPRDILLMVKIPPRLFSASWLSRHLEQALRESGLAAHRLELEVTETALFGTGPAAQVTINAVRRLGVRVAMERFGAGRSPFGYLRPFPFDEIKIDDSHIRRLATTETRDMVEATIHLGRHLGIGVVATAVETPEQLAFLRQAECPRAQGGFLSQAIPAAGIDQRLADHNPLLSPSGADAP